MKKYSVDRIIGLVYESFRGISFSHYCEVFLTFNKSYLSLDVVSIKV